MTVVGTGGHHDGGVDGHGDREADPELLDGAAAGRDAASDGGDVRPGRPKACGLCRAVKIACMYLRHNITEELVGDLQGISQPTVTRVIAKLVPM